MGDFGDGYDAVGFIGGVILGTALVPQIYLALRRRSTADISYVWQAVSTVGLLTLMVYYAHYSLWPVFYPMAFKLCCLVYLIGLKIYYEEFAQKKPDSAPTDPSDSDMINSGHVLQRTPSKLSLEALRSDMSCRSVEMGWVPSRASLGSPSDVTRSRMGASATSYFAGNHALSQPSNFFKPALVHRELNAEKTLGTADVPVSAGDHQA